MITIKRKTRDDVLITSKEQLEAFLSEKFVNFKRFTDKNAFLFDLLVKQAVYNSAAEFFSFYKSQIPKGLYTKFDFWGWTEEDISNRSKAESVRALKSKSSKIKQSGLSEKEYNKTQSCWCKEYWITKGYSEEEAVKQIALKQSNNSKKVKPENQLKRCCRRIEYWLEKGLSNEEAKSRLKLFQRTSSKRCVEYWMSRGSSLEESKILVSNNQSIVAKHYVNNVPSEERRKRNRLCREYWLEKGLTEKEIEKQLSDNGYAFSLKLCIEKYGEELGFEVWQKRQEKWQSALNSKPQEEIDEINSRKVPNGDYQRKRWEEFNVPGVLYLVEFNGHTKVGITIHNVKSRYGEAYLLNYKNKEYQLDDVYDAYMIEQLIIKQFSDRIIKDDYGKFGWTEVITNTTLEQINSECIDLLNNLDESKGKFESIKLI